MIKNNILKQIILRERDFISIGNPFGSFYNCKNYNKNIQILKNKSNKNIKVIVSLYNENIDWLVNFENVLVYNKGNKKINFPSKNVPNVGRDLHTIFFHIYNNYDQLDDYLVFLQAFPYDHSPNLNNNYNKIIERINKNEEIKFEYLSELIISSNIHVHNDFKTLNDIHQKIFSSDINNEKLIFGSGCQFIVSKENILKRSKEFYFNILKMVDYENCPYEIYEIERLLDKIFNNY